MNEVLRAAAALQSFCEQQDWSFCFIGGLALLRWGEPRETVDADLTLLTGFGGEEPFVRALLSKYEARVADPLEFALNLRVVLLRDPSGVGLDIALGALPFEASAVHRATRFELQPGLALRTCSAEDLIVMKTFASRTRDWADLEGVLIRQAGRLDWAYVLDHLTPLLELKGEPGILDRLAHLRAQLGA